MRRKSEFQGTVLIADDHEIFRLGLLQLLRRSLKVKRFLQAASFAQVMEHLSDEDVSLVILDLKMPGLTASTEIRRLRLLRPDARMVVLSGSECREDILGSLSAGAHGYIVKNQQTDQLIRRLRYILSGEMYVPASLAELLPETTVASTSKPIAELLKIELIQAATPSAQGAYRGQIEQGNCTSTRYRRGYRQNSSCGSVQATPGCQPCPCRSVGQAAHRLMAPYMEAEIRGSSIARRCPFRGSVL